jgi:glyoxalase family protein
MESTIRGLHHVTATVTDAQEDLDFYGRLLGLRLVKKTVNFDNSSVYHFYYGDERGTPGTLMTTFPYKGWNVPPGRKGAGQITATAFSVPADSLEAWRRRLAQAGVRYRDEGLRHGEEVIAFEDPSGLTIELVASARDTRRPWLGGVVTEADAIRGLHGVQLSIRSPARTLQLLNEVLGFEVVDEDDAWTRLAVNGDAPGHTLDVLHTPDAPQAANGLGTVHHVALAVPDAEEQLRMRDELVRLGLNVTEVRDRQYFRSIYFREPGGVLYEIATIPPGFTVDEDVGQLGCGLMLPPWEEPKRAQIEAGLAQVSY